MNIILISDNNIVESHDQQHHIVRVSDNRRLQHIRNILKAEAGQFLKVGLLDHNIGLGEVLENSADQITMRVVLDQSPPPPLPVVLLLALPRPLVLRRLLTDVTSYGVKRIVLLQTARVDKSYWQSPVLDPVSVHQSLLKGLEQARDTRLPQVSCHQSYAEFVRSDLQDLVDGAEQALIADPSATAKLIEPFAKRLLIAIGPEGGFIDREVARFESVGFRGVNLGSRLLRVETAVSGVLGRLSMG